jgi:hypothetical protein
MGLFLSMSGIVGAGGEAVVDALRAYAEDNEGMLEEAELTAEDDGCLVMSEDAIGVTVLYPGNFFDWDSASQYLSQRLGTPVFSFHIHDGDLWIYTLFEGGELVDEFNPVPDYWHKLDEGERRSCQGNATEVARRVPGLAQEQISKYLVQWGDDVFETAERKKAYPSDQFHYGDDWQLIDFMNKLGFDYPVDDRGVPHGATYLFKCEPEEAH